MEVDESDGEDLTVISYQPVLVTFEAIFTPPSDIADVDVLKIEPDDVESKSA